MSDSSAAGYGAKAAGYFAAARREWVDPLSPDPDLKVLELGCGAGATGALALSQGKCGAWIGVEMHGPSARAAAAVLTAVHAGDVETLELPYAAETFDLLVCGDVLEHLVDPAAALARLAPLLKTGGRLLASTPNIAHWQVIASLVMGRFDYADQGVMDATHLRWFTPTSLGRLVQGAGLTVERIGPLGWKRRSRVIAAALPMNHLLWRQIEVRGRK
jgi:SAM-dependent methyltransferase